MSVPSRYKGRPIEELISAGFYDPETRVVRAIKGYEFYVWSRDWQITVSTAIGLSAFERLATSFIVSLVYNPACQTLGGST
ncbi:hypothetical protein PYWP30_01260 [Pyrobaculum sp. WP30]|nr:hypothetical protein PYWP30_01260 [Pyrobaculum sp. WP30]